ncbi:hypothetical protein RZS08_26590, partial [Arthrospira platensis SPKY1]|nr:hypothetical protein [Arthrospira platensis SPKY1]
IGSVVGIEGRRIDQREDLASPCVQHHDTSSVSLVLLDRLAQRRIRNELDLLVDGQDEILAVLRQTDRFYVLDDLTPTVTNDAPGARASLELLLEGKLHTFL